MRKGRRWPWLGCSRASRPPRSTTRRPAGPTDRSGAGARGARGRPRQVLVLAAAPLGVPPNHRVLPVPPAVAVAAPRASVGRRGRRANPEGGDAPGGDGGGGAGGRPGPAVRHGAPRGRAGAGRSGPVAAGGRSSPRSLRGHRERRGTGPPR